MQFSAILLASAAGLVSAQKFGLIAIRSGSDFQNTPINSNGKQLVIGGGVETTYEIINRSLYANGKPVQFGVEANIVETDDQATRDTIVNGENHVYVPRFEWTACPSDNGYVLTNSDACKAGGLGLVPRAIFHDAPVNTTSAPVPATTIQTTSVVTVTSCADDKCHKETPAPAKSTPGAVVTQIGDGQIQAPTATPSQANGAAALGVPAAAAGIVAAAMLF